MTTRRAFLQSVSALGLAALLPVAAFAQSAVIDVKTPMRPPEWALLERELFRANTAACEEFFNRYFDERGYLLAFVRWGSNDGPDDAIENVNEWPHLHALGADDRILELYKKAWEGHLRQYTEAKTTEVPFARTGMYYKEFPVMMDWQHLSEGLSVFNLQGLSDPYDINFRNRAKRFAGFYMNEDPGAPNYDPKLKIIRSMFNGSRGPLLRETTALDWAGDPFEVEHRFEMVHGERSYEETLKHYEEYNETLGDHPINLQSTSLATNAYMLDNEPKYKKWVLEYIDAWIDRTKQNGGIIPSNVGLDGKIGSSAKGKWYGGAYGWGFSPVVPQTGEREDRNRVPRTFTAFMNAYLMTGDDKYLDVWRRQADVINRQAKVVDGKRMTPRMYGDNGWYSYKPGDYTFNFLDIYFLSMKPSDRARAGVEHPWVSYLEGKNPQFPVEALRKDLERVRSRVQDQRNDRSTPDTRLADNALNINPASVTSMIQLMQGGLHIARPTWSPTSAPQGGVLLHARLRYFDPVKRRAGVPEDVAALIDTMTDTTTAVSLVNVSQVESRTVTVQGGAYGEHQILAVEADGKRQAVNGRSFNVVLAPGAGARLLLHMKRYANQPTLSFPWGRTGTDPQSSATSVKKTD
jgi:hypothetical protein